MEQQHAQNGASENVVAAVSFVAVKPQLLVEAPKVNDAVLFYKAAFGAEEVGLCFTNLQQREALYCKSNRILHQIFLSSQHSGGYLKKKASFINSLALIEFN